MKYFFVLVVGLGGGYYLGFADGTAGKPSIVSRLVTKVGGSSRDRVANDIDALSDRLDGTVRPAPRKPAKTP